MVRFAVWLGTVGLLGVALHLGEGARVAPAQNLPPRIVAITGQPTPIGGSMANFAALSDLPGDQGPVLNRNGSVAFTGRLALTVAHPVVPALIANEFNDRGIWSEGSGVLSQVVREGLAAPGTGSTFGNYLREPVLNDLGHVAFHSNINGRIDDHAIWSNSANTLGLIARTGNSAVLPAGGGAQYASLDAPVFNNAGQIGFRGLLVGGDVSLPAGVNDRGLWTQAGNADLAVRQLTRAGQIAPLTPLQPVPTDTLQFTEFSIPVVNDLGIIAFRGTLSGGSVNPTNAQGIWAENLAGGMRLIAREGLPAPGTSQFYGAIGLPDINNQGQIAFGSRLIGNGGGAGIFRHSQGSVSPVALNGIIDPNNDSGLAFAGFGAPVINDRGRVAFSARLAGPGVVEGANDHSLWITTARGLRMIAREGDSVPGLPAGMTLDKCDAIDWTPTLNSRGQAAFAACFAGPDGAIAGEGLFAMDSRGNLTTVAYTGQTVTVAPGDVRVITDLKFRSGSGGSDGRGRSFDYRSDLVFWAALGAAPGGPATYAEAIISGSASSSTWGPGDVNGDGEVDRFDLSLLVDWWGSEDFWQGDFDLDGKITVNDLGILQSNYGLNNGSGPGESPPTAPVPEPATWLLALATLTAIAWRRRGNI